jgi:hypothetical protein
MRATQVGSSHSHKQIAIARPEGSGRPNLQQEESKEFGRLQKAGDDILLLEKRRR